MQNQQDAEVKRTLTAEETMAMHRAAAKIKAIPKRYVTVDSDGHPTGFWSDDVHANIPADAKAITEAQYRQFHEGQGANPPKRHKFIGGQLVEHGPALTLAQSAARAIHDGVVAHMPSGETFKFSATREALTTMAAVTLAVGHGGRFPADLETFPLRDTSGTWRELTVGQYLAVAAACASHASLCCLIIDGNPLKTIVLPATEIYLT